MRINIYDHDLTGRVESVEKTTDEGAKFNGVRIFLEEKRMHTPSDDDTAAVTFWYHEDGQHERKLLINSLLEAPRLLGVESLPPQ